MKYDSRLSPRLGTSLVASTSGSAPVSRFDPAHDDVDLSLHYNSFSGMTFTQNNHPITVIQTVPDVGQGVASWLLLHCASTTEPLDAFGVVQACLVSPVVLLSPWLVENHRGRCFATL